MTTATPGRELLALADKYARKAAFLDSAIIDDADRQQAEEYRKVEYALRLAAKPADEANELRSMSHDCAGPAVLRAKFDIAKVVPAGRLIIKDALEALSMWCTSERIKIRGRGAFDDQSEREIGIGIVETEIDRRATALSTTGEPKR